MTRTYAMNHLNKNSLKVSFPLRANPVLMNLPNLIVAMTISILVVSGCKQPEDHTQKSPVDTTTIDMAVAEKYVCPMHPQVISDEPGTCPVCGMDLVASGSGHPMKAGNLMLTPTQERLANIRVQRIGGGSIADGSVINARIASNEENVVNISSRAAGRIEKLYVRETGQTIRAGQPLYELYSEALIAQIQEYLMLKDQYTKLGDKRTHYESLVRSAAMKLIRYGLTTAQLDKLTRATTRVTFLAPASGTVSEVMAIEGQYIDEGAPLYRLDDLNKLWLEAALFPHEATAFKIGDRIAARIAGTGKIVDVRVEFITPAYRENTQIIVLRATLDNPDGMLRPGMQATIQRPQAGSVNLQVPLDAIIRDGDGARAFVRNAPQSYVMRMVETGSENASSIEITSGLTTGDEVVVSGAYLLYSELTLKGGAAAPGSNTAAHDHH